MKKNWGKYLLVLGLSLLLSIAASPVRLWGFPLSMSIYFVVYILLTFWLLRKYSNKLPAWSVTLVIIVGAIAIDTPLRIAGDHSVMMSLPEFIFRILAPLVALAVWKTRSKVGKVAILLVATVTCLWMAIFGYNYWASKVNYATYTGRIEQSQSNTLSFQTSVGDTVMLADIGGRYVVLDFFTSSCGSCFEAMPKVQALYDKCKSSDEVVVYGVHWRYDKQGETFDKGAKLIGQMSCNFPCLSTDLNDSKLKELVTCVPTVLIFDQTTEQFILRGSIDQATDLLSTLL